jgi:hypothetical protein
MYAVDTIFYYSVTFFQYYVIKLKLIRDNVLNSYCKKNFDYDIYVESTWWK